MPRVLWEYHSIQIFCLHRFFFQLHSRAQGDIQIKICFGTMKDLPIWFFWNKGIFVSQNSYEHIMVLSSFSGDYFVFVRLDQKVASHRLVSVSMNKNWIKIRKLVVCKGFNYIPSNQEDIIFLTRLIFIWNLISRLKRFRFEFRVNW